MIALEGQVFDPGLEISGVHEAHQGACRLLLQSFKNDGRERWKDEGEGLFTFIANALYEDHQ